MITQVLMAIIANLLLAILLEIFKSIRSDVTIFPKMDNSLEFY
jgi:hypothetical protein